MKPAQNIQENTSHATTEQNQTTQQQQTSAQQQQQTTASEQASSNLGSFLQNYLSQNAGTATTSLSPFQQPVAQQYFQDILKNYQSGSLLPKAYAGERVAALTPEQLRAQSMATNYATGVGGDLTGSALSANKLLLDPNYILNPANIPGLNQAKAANTTTLTRNLTENQLPAIRGSALLDNTYGGSRQGIAEGLATGRTNEAIANANNSMDLGAYTQGLQAMQNALGIAPGTFQAGLAPSNTVSQVGAQNQGQQQQQLEAGKQAFQEQQASTNPGSALAMLQQLMGVQGQYGGSTTQTGQTTGSQSGTQVAQQLASMLGLSTADLQAMSQGTSTGTMTGTSDSNSRTVGTQKPSTIQQLSALASLAMIPFTFGMSALPLAAGGMKSFGGGAGAALNV